MKYRILIIILALLPLYSIAQLPLLTEDRLWTMVEIHCLPQGNTYQSHYLELGPDTTIEGQVYRSLRYAADETQSTWYPYGGFIRETGDGKVYYKKDNAPEGLIYDFSAGFGDTVVVINPELIPEPLNFVVTVEDSIYLEDGWHRMLVLQDTAFPGEETWIEGVGSLSGLVKSGLTAFGSACGDFDLLCTSDDGFSVYVNPEYPACWYVYTRITDPEKQDALKIYPNPVGEHLFIEAEMMVPGEKYLLRIADFSGRIIHQEQMTENSFNTSFFPPGMYILTITTSQGTFNGKMIKQK